LLTPLTLFSRNCLNLVLRPCVLVALPVCDEGLETLI
jgi:hypothetical protein